MKQIFTLFSACIIAHVAVAQTFDWAYNNGTPVQDEGHAIVTDATNHVYTVGRFRGTADFDPGDAVFELTSDNNDDIYIQKVNSSGELVWAKQIGGTSFDVVHDIDLDQSGNIYIVGSFFGVADFDPSDGLSEMTSYGLEDAFVIKMSPDGELIWMKQFGGEYTDECIAVEIDQFGDVYTTGRFQTTADFQPGEGSVLLSASGFSDDEIFLCKHSSDGDIMWAKKMGGSLNEQPTDICINNINQVYLTGFYYGSGDYDGNDGVATLIAQGYTDGFIACYTLDGDYQWAHTIGGVGYDVGHALVSDGLARIYVAARFENTIDVDPGASEFNLTASMQDIAIMKFETDGSFLWAKQWGGTGVDVPQSMDIDALQQIYCTGSFQGTADFDGNNSTLNLTSAGSEDIFISKMDTDGNTWWVGAMGSSDAVFGDVGKDITIDASGDILVTGWFYNTADFDPSDAATFPITSQGSFDAFVVKVDQPDVSISELNEQNFDLFPNPSHGFVQWNIAGFIGNGRLTLYNSIGQILLEQTLNVSTNELQLPSAAGIYHIRLTDESGKVWMGKVERR